LVPLPRYIEFEKTKQPKSPKSEILKPYKTGQPSGFSLSVLLISGPYLHAAGMAEMRRESREVLSGDGFHALRDLHLNGMI
jgi:hypothetical protein